MKTLLALLALTSLPAFAGNIAARQVHQQQRIAQGVREGQLTPRETMRLERQEDRLHREVVRDRRSGGHLSRRERAHLEREQNRLSRHIARARHN